MKRPVMITSKQLYNTIHDQFGLDAYVNGDMILHKILERPIPTHCLTRIAAAQFWVPIEGVTRHDQDLLIPDSNLVNITTLYVTDLSKWIMFIQSNVDKDKAYAWEIRYNRIAPALRIQPFNTKLRDAAWRVIVTDRIQGYVQLYFGACLREMHRDEYARQHPVTPDQAYTASMQATQRVPRFAAQWPPNDPAMEDLETEIINQILNKIESQTN